MKISFIPNSSDARYSVYSPSKQGLIRFVKSGEYEVPDDVGKELLLNRPDIFAIDLIDIPEEVNPPVADVQIPEPVPSHPLVKAMKKAEQMTKKVPRRLTKKG